VSAKKTPKAKPTKPVSASPPAPAEASPLSKPKTTGEKLGLHMYARMLAIMRSHGAEALHGPHVGDGKMHPTETDNLTLAAVAWFNMVAPQPPPQIRRQ
jgi:hypothetical protein